jgi:putative transposase
MPSGLKRFQESGQSHFITFSCYHRRPMFAVPASRQIFELALESARLSFNLCGYDYTGMPEHIHLLLSEPDGAPFKPAFGLSGGKSAPILADAMKSLKQGVSRRLIGETNHFWQKRYYDFNVRDHPQFMEKLRYIHRNPVKRGLCQNPEDWEWSSFLHYATGFAGRVEIESEWISRKRERAAGRLAPAIEFPPFKPKAGLNGAPRKAVRTDCRLPLH